MEAKLVFPQSRGKSVLPDKAEFAHSLVTYTLQRYKMTQ